MSDLKKNMALWDAVCETDPAHTRPVSLGKRRFTAIDAQWQRKKATELWGPYGKDWGLRDIQWSSIGSPPVEITMSGWFFYPDGAFYIATDIAWKLGGECRKKLMTDCLTKALSYLGFSADIFMGLYDDNRYVEQMATKYGSEVRAPQAPEPPKSTYQVIRDFLADRKNEKDWPASIARIAHCINDGKITPAEGIELHIESLIVNHEFTKAAAQLDAADKKPQGVLKPVRQRLRDRIVSEQSFVGLVADATDLFGGSPDEPGETNDAVDPSAAGKDKTEGETKEAV